MKKSKILIISFMALICSTTVLAEQTPQSLSADHRVKIINYEPDNVIALKVHYGYETDVIFDTNETIERVANGDSLAWQTIPTSNHLFVKPIAASNTNMTVLTNLRSYNFVLESPNNQNPYDQIFELKFIYPDDDHSISSYNTNPAPTECTPTQCNWKYSFTGDKQIAPVQTFDDGKFTYFKFRSNGSAIIPAIYSVDKNKNESLVNYHMQNDYLVVNRVSNQFTLRDGALVTSVYNDYAIGDWESIK